MLKSNKNERIHAKRKISELLINELDIDESEETKRNKEDEDPVFSFKTPTCTDASSQEINNHFENESSKSTKIISILDLFEQTQTETEANKTTTKRISIFDLFEQTQTVRDSKIT